ncbi:hypothetical protein M440DRAFT_1035950 [Trichoderma longibrachiatum ATCC 18648]|uniref:Uncharacterized protein n=1 Tax=Trichoderma longibrachiatum ATCC 18648 TaxID=983965 RepID=A0A2T4C012_TRILO|nr:hypothetical protein M440DRAFT_1035950 [Trichoderma longibrachiatum ATCC 18648]
MSIGSCWVASEPDILCRHACLGGRLYCGHILRLTLFRPLRFGIRKMRSQGGDSLWLCEKDLALAPSETDLIIRSSSLPMVVVGRTPTWCEAANLLWGTHLVVITALGDTWPCASLLASPKFVVTDLEQLTLNLPLPNLPSQALQQDCGHLDSCLL